MLRFTVTYYLFDAINKIIKRIINYKSNNKNNCKKIIPISNNVIVDTKNKNTIGIV